MIRLVSIVSVALLLGGCATRPKTYQAPDTKRLTVAIDKAQATEARARAHIESAQKSADKLKVTSASVIAQAKELKALVPPELLERVKKLEQAAEEQLVEEGNLETHIDGARVEHSTLAKDLAEAMAAKLEHEERDRGLAQGATNERNYRIAAEKQLSLQRWYGRFAKIGIGLLILLVAGFFVLKWMGKLGVVAAKIGFKAAV